MTAPDRIALRWELGAAVTSGPLMDHPDYTQYVRADLARPTPLAEALAVIDTLKAEFEAGGSPTAAMVLDLARERIAALRAIGEGEA